MNRRDFDREARSARLRGDWTCGTCGAPLDLHQPDPDLPDRFLGTCRVCKAWWLLDGASDAVTPLPTPLGAS
jgi:hypothetical protein